MSYGTSGDPAPRSLFLEASLLRALWAGLHRGTSHWEINSIHTAQNRAFGLNVTGAHTKREICPPALMSFYVPAMKGFGQMSSYLQAGWWVRSRAPPRSFPSWCRCTSCTASRGQSGQPRRSHWLYPPAGWALPSGPLPPQWTCKPYPPAPRRWQYLSWCASACFQVMRVLLSGYSSLDIMKKSIKLDVVQCGHTALYPRGFFPRWLQQASHKAFSLSS